MNFKRLRPRPWLLLVILSMAIPASATWKEKVLYSFQDIPDGATPAGGVVFDKAGSLYGATGWGGAGNCLGIAQCGTVYQLQPPAKKNQPWTENVLYTFKGKDSNDGETPAGGVLFDQAGNLYGTTHYGGAGHCILLGGDVGCGTVFQMTPPKVPGSVWTYSLIYSFQGGKDGYAPVGDLVFDSAGNLYGATQFGGGFSSCDPFYAYCGTIFELIPPKNKGGSWTEKVLYSFKNKKDGADPNGGLVLGKKGALYGTTYCGGDAECQNLQGGDGVLFRLRPPIKDGVHWSYKVLHTFANGDDGSSPNGDLILDSRGALYGTTMSGGSDEGGVVFMLRPPRKGQNLWAETVLYTFFDGAGGVLPGGLVFDSLGKLYGVARGGKLPGGVVFRLNPQQSGRWTYSVLYNLEGPPDGKWPQAALVPDVKGALYGTTLEGGTGGCTNGCGTVFEVNP